MITSIHNRGIAEAVRLKKRAMREQDRRFLVEGPQAVGEALASGARVHDAFVTGPAEGRLEGVLSAAQAAGLTVRAVSPEVMAHLTSTVTPQGLVAVASFVDVPLDAVREGAGCVAVLVEVRDPGNAGTILRSADAAGAGGVVFTRSSVDVYNPKTVRATAGSLFHVPVVREVDIASAVDHLRANGFTVLAGNAGAEASVYDTDLTGPTAILFGNEARGLPDAAGALVDGSLRVPIAGRAESLNLAAAATLVLFEAARQRGRSPGLAELVAGAAHDIRSPLTAVQGFATTMLSRWDRLADEQRKTMLEGIAHDGERMATVVTELVDAARLAAGTLRLSPVPTDLLDAARSAAQGRSRDGTLDVVVQGRPEQAEVDPDRLRTIIGALIEAAQWWGEEGPVTIRVAKGPVVTVGRTGTSLALDQARALFRPRAPGTGGGSKVGLFVAKGLAEAHGGSLDVSTDGAIRFVLTLPGR